MGKYSDNVNINFCSSNYEVNIVVLAYLFRGLFHKGLAIANCNLLLAVSISLVVSMETRANSLAAANHLACFQ